MISSWCFSNFFKNINLEDEALISLGNSFHGIRELEVLYLSSG